MDIILIPGLWLDGSSWAKVVPILEAAGHRAHPITLPGMESRETDRSGITLRDHVEAVVAAIDAVAPAAGQVVLVGHSAGAGIAHAALDARPDRVARAIYIGGFPTGDGDTIADGFPARNGEIPLPDWSAFSAEDLAELDERARAEFRACAVPSPERVTRDPQRLTNERRYDVPVTVICPEFTAEMLQRWIDQGQRPVREFAKIRDVTFVDLPTGHWPQFTRPVELGQAILDAIAASSVAAPSRTFLDEQGRYVPGQDRPEPPVAAGEAATLLGYLERQRATFAWKVGGLDAAGLRATLGSSAMTLGGMLKHLARFEDDMSHEWLLGRGQRSPWDAVDWDADPAWDWRTAADESPEQLYGRWREAVARSRAIFAEALASGGLEQPALGVTDEQGVSPTLRYILLNMIEEYARHNGHADLIREAVDGLVGHDPPG